jgi:hypothetical protein
MFLKDISVSAERGGKLPDNRHHKIFNRGTHAAAIAFQKALGSKFILDNVKKINILLFPPREGDQKYQNLVDVSVYHYENFNFESYFEMSKVEQEHYLLKVIKESLLEVAKITRIEKKPIEDAYKKVLKEKFPLDDSFAEAFLEQARKSVIEQKIKDSKQRHIQRKN